MKERRSQGKRPNKHNEGEKQETKVYSSSTKDESLASILQPEFLVIRSSWLFDTNQG